MRLFLLQIVFWDAKCMFTSKLILSCRGIRLQKWHFQSNNYRLSNNLRCLNNSPNELGSDAKWSHEFSARRSNSRSLAPSGRTECVRITDSPCLSITQCVHSGQTGLKPLFCSNALSSSNKCPNEFSNERSETKVQFQWISGHSRLKSRKVYFHRYRYTHFYKLDVYVLRGRID